MILEGIVTTVSSTGVINIAPMGPRIGSDPTRFLLRPFQTSRTYQNLKANGEGVLHVTDDVLLLAKAAIGPIEPKPAVRAALKVNGVILTEACRWSEFRVLTLHDSAERTSIEVEVVADGRQRDFFGFNRAKHAVLEAAILATRVAFLPVAEIEAEYRKFEVIVAKTGGPAEQEAFALLRAYVSNHAYLGNSTNC